MTTYTNESIQNIKKKDLIPIILSLQNKLEEVNNNVLVEIRNLNESFSKLQSGVSVTKQVNTLLSSRLVSIERQCWLNAQYSRRACLDIVGIPSEVEADALEEKVVAIFEKLGCHIPTKRIEEPHSHCQEKELHSHCQVFTKKGLPAGLRYQERLAKNKDEGY